MLGGYAGGTVDFSAERSKTTALLCCKRVFPRTHEPSITSRRCVCAAAPGLTVRPPASASPQSSSTDGAGQTNFLQCRSGDIIQVDRCTCFRAPDHGTNTRTRIFARVSRLFVEMGGKNLHGQTLTAAPILVTASGRLVGRFFKWPRWAQFLTCFVFLVEFVCSGWLCDILSVRAHVLSPCGRSEEVRGRHAITSLEPSDWMGEGRDGHGF